MQSTTSSPDLALSNDIRSKSLRRRTTVAAEPTGLDQGMTDLTRSQVGLAPDLPAPEAAPGVVEAEHALAVAQASGHEDWIDAAEQLLQVERDLAPKPRVDFDAGYRGSPTPQMSGTGEMTRLIRADWLDIHPDHLPPEFQ